MDGKSDSEGYYDFLTNGAYINYLFDYERDSQNLGTYLNLQPETYT
jgi:hypothetical protein